MKRTVMTAALFAAFAMPALADDTMIRNDNAAAMSTPDQVTTGSTSQQSDIKPVVTRDKMDGGCMHRYTTTQNMM